MNLITAEWIAELLTIIMADGIDYIENSLSFPNDWVMSKLSFASQPLWNHLWKEILIGYLHAYYNNET